MLSGAESVTGRLVDFPASRHFFCAAPEVSRGKTVPRNNGPKTPRHRVSVSRRYTGHPVRRMGTNRLTTRNRGLHCFGLRFELRLAAIGGENHTEKVSGCYSGFRNFFGDVVRWVRRFLFDYSVVNFSMLSFSDSFFYRKGLFFVAIRLVNLFPLHLVEGTPSTR